MEIKGIRLMRNLTNVEGGKFQDFESVGVGDWLSHYRFWSQIQSSSFLKCKYHYFDNDDVMYLVINILHLNCISEKPGVVTGKDYTRF